MTLKVALVAAIALILLAVSPAAPDTPVRRAVRTARRALIRGIVCSICPECCKVIDEQGKAVTLDLNASTTIAGSLGEGDQVDVLAEVDGVKHTALSIVKIAGAPQAAS